MSIVGPDSALSPGDLRAPSEEVRRSPQWKAMAFAAIEKKFRGKKFEGEIPLTQRLLGDAGSGRILISPEEYRGAQVKENGLVPFFTTKQTNKKGRKALGWDVVLGSLKEEGYVSQEAETLDDLIEAIQSDQEAKKTGGPRLTPGGITDYEIAMIAANAGYFQYAGEQANMSEPVRANLAEAQRLAEAQTDNETIRQKTGWFKGMDGKWRYEIPDGHINQSAAIEKLAKLKESRQPAILSLSDLYDNEALYKAYPSLRHRPVRVVANNGASYNPEQDSITISANTLMDRHGNALTTLVHEIQHAIQKREGFAKGGSPEQFAPKRIMGDSYFEALARMEEIEKEHPGLYDLAFQYMKLMGVWHSGEQIDEAGLSERASQIYDEGVEKFGKAFEEYTNQYMASDAARVGAKEISPEDQYRNLAGEIEARDAASRADYGSEHRRISRPDLREDAIVLFGGEQVASYSTEQSDPLVAVHNLSAENLRFVAGLGGLPVPSIGITKADTPFSDFGDISLIGSKDMVDPADTPVFSFDAYSARFPETVWPKVPREKAQAFLDSAREFFDLVGADRDLHNVWYNLINTPNRDKALREFIRSDGAKVMFLAEQGQSFAPVMQEASETKHGSMSSEIQALVNEGVDRNFQSGDETHKRVSDAYRAYLKRQKLGKRTTGYLLDADESGLMSFKNADALLGAAYDDRSRVGTQETDTGATREQLGALVPQNSPEFIEWAAQKINPLFDKPSIKHGKRTVPLTLENVVKAMTSRDARGKEDTPTYNKGNVKAAISKRFKSLKELQAARDSVVSPEEAIERDKSVDETLSAYRDAVLTSYTAKDHNGEIDTWSGLDDSMRSLAEAIKRGGDEKALKSALERNGFKNPDAEALRLGVEAMAAIEQDITDYFEAKPQRAVSLSEFASAVVPEGTPQDVVKILTDAGLQVREYAKDGKQAQAQAVTALSRELNQQRGDVYFQSAPEQPSFPVEVKNGVRIAQPTATSNIGRGLEVARTLPVLNVADLFDKETAFDEALKAGETFYRDKLMPAPVISPAFQSEPVAFTEEGWEHLVGTKEREVKLSDSNIGRRLRLLPKVEEVLRTTPYVDMVRTWDDGTIEYSLLGRFKDGSVIRVVVRGAATDKGKTFFTVFDWEDVSKRLKRLPSPDSLHVTAGYGVGEAPSVRDKDTIGQAPGDVKPRSGGAFSLEQKDPVRRGFIEFGPDWTKIGFLKDANLSTFLHETGHFWLEMLRRYGSMENAPEQIKNDWAIVQKHLGIEGIAADAKIPVEAAEKWALSAEQYFMEGKAPSVELQGAFARFKAWMRDVYKNISQLITLTPEVRGVFDRLLATEEEITAAEEKLSLKPLFATAEAAGMSQAEFDLMRRDAEAAHEKASEAVEREVMRELRREKEQAWQEEREKVREQVDEESKNNAVFQVYHLLTRGELLDGSKPFPWGQGSQCDMIVFIILCIKIIGIAIKNITLFH